MLYCIYGELQSEINETSSKNIFINVSCNSIDMFSIIIVVSYILAWNIVGAIFIPITLTLGDEEAH